MISQLNTNTDLLTCLHSLLGFWHFLLQPSLIFHTFVVNMVIFFFLLRCFWDFVSIAAMQIFPGIWLSIYRSHIMTLAENVVSLSNYKIKCFALCLFQWLWTVSPSRSTVSSTAKLRSQLPGKLGTFSLSNSPLLRASCYCPRSKGQQQETVKQLLSWTEGSVYSSSQWTQAVEGSPVNIRISQYRRFNLRRF